MTTVIFPHIERAMVMGHQDPRIDRRRKDCKASIRMIAAPERRIVVAAHAPTWNERTKREAKRRRANPAEARLREETDKAVAAAVVRYEPHPEQEFQSGLSEVDYLWAAIAPGFFCAEHG